MKLGTLLGKLVKMAGNKNLFANQGHSELYSKYRPAYPEGLVSRILGHLGRGKVKPFGLAVDIGCGTGQFTRSLSPHFERVLGVDVSESQLAAARETPVSNVEYLYGTGESIPAENSSTDLITGGMSLHWFDFNKFCDEARRILKPGGCIAVFGYEMQSCRINGKKVPELEEAFEKLITENTKPYWTPERKQVFNGYADVLFPFEDNQRDNSYAINQEISLSDYIGLVKSLSFYQSYIKANPDKPDAAEILQQRTLEVLGVNMPPHQTTVTLYLPVFMVLTRKSSSQ